MVEPDRPLRIGIWAAVSSKEQATEDKASLQDQERLGRAFSQELGAEVVAAYRVPGQSRDLVLWSEAEATIAAYRQLREDLEAGRIDLLWALDVDRLGRDPALSSQVQSLAERHGAEVYLSTAPHLVGQQTIGHRYVTAIQAVRAKEDQARRVKNIRVGLENRARLGLPHRWPYGYSPTRDPHTGRTTGAEFHPDQIAAVRAITELFLAGHPYHQIVKTMNQSAHRPAHGGRWAYNTIRNYMHNDTFAGIVSWGDLTIAGISDRFPALWDPPTYRAILKERRRRAVAWTRHDGSPLAGVAFCGRGSSRMHCIPATRERPYLRCGRHAIKHRTGIPCHPNTILEHKVLAALTQFIAEELTPEAIAATVSQSDPAAPLRAELEDLQRAITRLENQRRRIALDRAEEIMLPDAYRLADDSLLERLGHAQDQAAALVAEIESLPDPAARAAHLQAIAASFAQDLEEKPPSTIATALQNAGLGIWIESGEISYIGFVV